MELRLPGPREAPKVTLRSRTGLELKEMSARGQVAVFFHLQWLGQRWPMRVGPVLGVWVTAGWRRVLMLLPRTESPGTGEPC